MINRKIFFVFWIFILVLGVLISEVAGIYVDPSTYNNPSAPNVNIPVVPVLGSSTKIDKEIGDNEEDIKNTLGYSGVDEAKGKKIKINRLENSKNTKIDFKEGGSLTINGNSVKNVKENGNTKPYIILNEKGEIIDGAYETTETGKYPIGNEIIELPKGARVTIKDGKAHIDYPPKSKIIAPKLMKESETGETRFYFKYTDNSAILLDGYEFSGTLIYEKKNLYFDDNVQLKFGSETVLIKNPGKVLTRITFDGEAILKENYNGAYFSINKAKKKLIVGINSEGVSPSVALQKDSIFASDFPGGSDFIEILSYSVKGEPAFIHLTGRLESKKSARAGTLNGYVINWDGKSPYFNSEKGQVLIRKKPIIKSETPSDGYVPLLVESYKTDNEGKIICAFNNCNKMVLGDDGRVGVGPDPGWVPVKGGNYGNYPGFFHGASEWLVYYEKPSENTFERFTGVNLIDTAGMLKENPEEAKILMDVLGNIPRDVFKNLKNVELRPWAGFSGRAWTTGYVELNVGAYKNKIPIRTAFHEFAHIRDFYIDYENGRSNFEKEWRAVGGYSGPQTYWYGYTGGESTSTFAEMITKDSWGSENSGRYFSSWSYALSDKYSYHKQIRAKVALFSKYKFITPDATKRVFDLAGLPSDPASLERYIQGGKR